MKNETFEFIQDVKTKKAIAKSSRNRRTHAGKGGSVKFPSDYLSKKELKAMNGQAVTYRMNNPMNWKEFKSLPDDLKIVYLTAIHDKYEVPFSNIAEDMMGISRCSMSRELSRLGISQPRGGNYTKKWDRDAWHLFLHGTSSQKPILEPQNCPKTPVSEPKEVLVPAYGTMAFNGTVDEVAAVIKGLIGGGTFHLTISWSEK